MCLVHQITKILILFNFNYLKFKQPQVARGYYQSGSPVPGHTAVWAWVPAHPLGASPSLSDLEATVLCPMGRYLRTEEFKKSLSALLVFLKATSQRS